jgi:hypothetical protein
MTALPEDQGATYGEAVLWSYWLENFTPSDLSDSMIISPDLAYRFCLGLARNGTVRDTGERVDGEPLYQLVPLPKGPNIHWTDTPPEMDKRIGVYAEAPPRRGQPVPGTAGSQTRKAARVHRSRVG